MISNMSIETTGIFLLCQRLLRDLAQVAINLPDLTKTKFPDGSDQPVVEVPF